MAESFKASCQSFLKRAGAYQRIKSSFLYDAYWSVANRRLLDEREQQVAFFRETLAGFSAGALIFDIGANQGYKTDIFLRLGARVIAVDPDPANQEILRQRFLTCRLQKKPVTIIGKAVSDREGVETMWVDEPGSAKNTLNVKWVETLRSDAKRFGSTLQFGEETKVETVTLEQLIATCGRPFYIKIDVEGYEAAVLKGLHSAVPYVSFEVNLPEFRSEGQLCIDLLHAVVATGQFNYSADAQGGLALKEWMPHQAFLRIFEGIGEPSVEVFWRTLDRQTTVAQEGNPAPEISTYGITTTSVALKKTSTSCSGMRTRLILAKAIPTYFASDEYCQLDEPRGAIDFAKYAEFVDKGGEITERIRGQLVIY